MSSSYRLITTLKSSHPKVFLGKDFPKICCKFTGEHPGRSALSIKFQSNFIKIALRHISSPVNLLHIFSKPFIKKNTWGWLLLSSANLISRLLNIHASFSRSLKNCLTWSDKQFYSTKLFDVFEHYESLSCLNTLFLLWKRIYDVFCLIKDSH